jgi:FxsC-like protein
MTVTHDVPAPYFFLSYARSDPLAGNPEEDPDEPVVRFFADLTAAVKRHASNGRKDASGFFDLDIPVGSDWKQFATRALSAAQVFVPLYSVGYLTNSWPGRELASFKKRVEVTGRENPARRLVPVLWAPLAGVQYPPELREALDSSVTERDYADNGLRALLKLKSYHDLYKVVVDRMGAQIVEIAERDPIEPVEPEIVGDIEKAPSAFPADRPLPVFSIEIAAPTTADAPAPALANALQITDLQTYGDTPEDWRPFPGQELPLAEYARQLIRRFDFEARVEDFGAETDPAGRRPGIIVIDPAFITEETGQAALQAVADTLPRWVLPLVVVAPDDEPTRNLAARVLDILPKARALATDSLGRASRGVKSLDEFVAIVPVLVAEAERQYFRNRNSRASSPGSLRRPRLGRTEGSDAPPAT